MYVGRIVAVGLTPSGRGAVMYRVSSRSFPNREARLIGETVAIMPKAGHEGDLSKNPYIAYNCLRLAGNWAVATNGSHTDPVVEKIAAGMGPRDALTLSLLAMDYEKDSLDTPRIAAVVSQNDAVGFLAVVRKNGLQVEELPLEKGRAHYVATYERNFVSQDFVDDPFEAETAEEASARVMNGGAFAELEKPVTAAAAVATEHGFAIAAR